jgi:hypothetical protein
MGVLRHLHPLVEVDLPPFVDDFHPKIKVFLDRETYIFVLARSPCLVFGGPSNMVYEILQNGFLPYDYVSGFNVFLEVCGHIVQGHVPPLILCLFFTFQLLMLKK